MVKNSLVPHYITAADLSRSLITGGGGRGGRSKEQKNDQGGRISVLVKETAIPPSRVAYDIINCKMVYKQPFFHHHPSPTLPVHHPSIAHPSPTLPVHH